MEAPSMSMQAQMGDGYALLMLSPMSQPEQKVLTECVCMRPADCSLTAQHGRVQAALQGPDCTAII